MVYIVEELAHALAIWAHGKYSKRSDGGNQDSREETGGSGTEASGRQSGQTGFQLNGAGHGDHGHKDLILGAMADQGSFQV